MMFFLRERGTSDEIDRQINKTRFREKTSIVVATLGLLRVMRTLSLLRGIEGWAVCVVPYAVVPFPFPSP